MSRQDFERLADTLAHVEVGEVARTVFALAMADKLGARYPRFDRRRFLEACNIDQMAIDTGRVIVRRSGYGEQE